MANKVLLKKSSVAAKVPLTTDLDYGELALNYTDGKLYFKNASNVVKSFTIDDSVVTLAGTQTLTNKTLTSPTIGTSVTLNAQAPLRFADSDSSNWVAFRAPATIASNVTWTLPSADGTTGQVLSTNGTGTLSWTSAAGGGGGYGDLVEISSTGISSSTTVYSTSATTYRGAKYTIQITNSTAYAMYEFLVMHDGTSVYFPYSSSGYAGDSNGNFQSYFSGDYLHNLATMSIQVGSTFHALNWTISGGNLVFSASCSSGTISVKGAVLLIKA